MVVKIDDIKKSTLSEINILPEYTDQATDSAILAPNVIILVLHKGE